jgi:hypothetical protein
MTTSPSPGDSMPKKTGDQSAFRSSWTKNQASAALRSVLSGDSHTRHAANAIVT